MDVKKKIYFIVPSMRGGGSERVISILVNNLDRTKYDVSLVLLQKEGRYLDDLASDVKIIDLNAKRARYSIFKIVKILMDDKPDIVFSTLGHLNLLISMLRFFFPKSMKFIARESSIVSVNNNQEKFPKVFDFLYRKFYDNFDLIISQSHCMKNDLVNNYDIVEDKIKVINNPVDIDKITKLMQTDEILFDKNKINLLSVGRLNAVKGYDLLFQSLAKLDDKYHLTILGEGAQKESLLKLSLDLGIQNRVIFKGFESNPYKYMAQANLMVLSSRYEGFPNVVLEANACGTPVVAFNCSGGTGEIIEDGVNGFLVACGDVNLLAKRIDEAVVFEWDKEKVSLLILKRYNLDYIIEKYQTNI